MTGSLVVHQRPLDRRGRAVRRAPGRLDNGRELVYRDVRRLGTLLLLDDRQWARYTEAIGPEPLDDDFTAEQLGLALRRSPAGGEEGDHGPAAPRRRGKHLRQRGAVRRRDRPVQARAAAHADDQHVRLHREIRRILGQAIASSGTTFRDYRTGTGEPGNFQLELFVYGREGEPCRRCGTRLTGTHAIDARITVFCHRCQS